MSIQSQGARTVLSGSIRQPALAREGGTTLVFPSHALSLHPSDAQVTVEGSMPKGLTAQSKASMPKGLTAIVEGKHAEGAHWLKAGGKAQERELAFPRSGSWRGSGQVCGHPVGECTMHPPLAPTVLTN